MLPWLDRGFEGAGIAGCIFAVVVLWCEMRAKGADRDWGAENSGLLAIFAVLVLTGFVISAALF
jgi:hypothetical protein